MPKTPTLTDFVVAAHFESDIPFRVLDLADWTHEFRDEFPATSQLQALGRLDLVTNPYQFVPVSDVPLMQVNSSDGGLYIKLQADRIAFGWNGVVDAGISGNYPGYISMMDRWRVVAERFDAWMLKRMGQSSAVRLVEIGYINVKALINAGQPAKLSDTIKMLVSTGRIIHGFQLQWTELFDLNPMAPRVNGSASVGTMTDGSPAMQFSFTGLASVSGSIAGSELVAMVDALHARIVDMYDANIISDSM